MQYFSPGHPVKKPRLRRGRKVFFRQLGFFGSIRCPDLPTDGQRQREAAGKCQIPLLIYSSTTGIQNSTTLIEIYPFFSDNQAIFFRYIPFLHPFAGIRGADEGQIPHRQGGNDALGLLRADVGGAVGLAGDQQLPTPHRIANRAFCRATGHGDRADDPIPLCYQSGPRALLR